ncbi:MAG: hypothetical protein J2P36_24075 [Ktedonobacteraceae bacterium]|nr:hypothetical protein [Ktedonobacteraceae bacterium]
MQEPCLPYSHNIIWRFFQSEARSLYQEWEKQAQSLVAQLRADYTRYPDDPSFCALIATLQEHCPQFCQWWEQQNIDDTPNGLRILAHPTLGDLTFEHITLNVPFSSDLRIKVCSMQEDVRARLEQALLTSLHEQRGTCASRGTFRNPIFLDPFQSCFSLTVGELFVEASTDLPLEATNTVVYCSMKRSCLYCPFSSENNVKREIVWPRIVHPRPLKLNW